LEPKKKIVNHIFDFENEYKKCKNDPMYFHEKYWLPYALGIKNTCIKDVDRFILKAYWSTGVGDRTGTMIN